MTLAMTSPVSWPLCPPRFGTPRRAERRTLGPQVGLVAEAFGKPLMPWQQYVADIALEIDPETGRFAYREVVLTVPRRSGKSLLLLALLVQRMVAMGRPQVAAFTMQNALQARLRMRREWDAEILSRSSLASAYRFTGQPGAEALLFNNGSRIEVTASTKSSGHGLTLDLAVVDEAFDQPDDRLEQAFRPAIRTQPDAQLWWVSTAGGPEDKWFKAKVDQARAGADFDRGTAVFDWSAAEDDDPGDPAVWWSCMPALGYVRPDGSGLTEQDIREEYESALRAETLDGFRRAYLNQWVAKKASANAIDPAIWSGLFEPAPLSNPSVFALDVSPTHDHATITAGWKTPSGSFVQIAEHAPGVEWVPGRWAQLQSRYGGRLIVEQTGTAAFLLPLLTGTEPVSRRFYADACSSLDAAVTSRSLRHGNQPELNDATAAARWKTSPDGQRTIARKDPRVSPLVAAALALHGLNGLNDGGGWVMAL